MLASRTKVNWAATSTDMSAVYTAAGARVERPPGDPAGRHPRERGDAYYHNPPPLADSVAHPHIDVRDPSDEDQRTGGARPSVHQLLTPRAMPAPSRPTVIRMGMKL
jgi:hypothetical protein